jgi:hypothetical protein
LNGAVGSLYVRFARGLRETGIYSVVTGIRGVRERNNGAEKQHEDEDFLSFHDCMFLIGV